MLFGQCSDAVEAFINGHFRRIGQPCNIEAAGAGEFNTFIGWLFYYLAFYPEATVTLAFETI